MWNPFGNTIQTKLLNCKNKRQSHKIIPQGCYYHRVLFVYTINVKTQNHCYQHCILFQNLFSWYVNVDMNSGEKSIGLQSKAVYWIVTSHEQENVYPEFDPNSWCCWPKNLLLVGARHGGTAEHSLFSVCVIDIVFNLNNILLYVIHWT